MFNKTYSQDEFIEVKNITLDYNYNQTMLVPNLCFLNYFNGFVSFTVTSYFSFKNILFYLSVVPVIREVPKVITIIKKKTIVIECRVNSVFEPKVIWMKEKTAIKQDSRHSVKIEEVKEVCTLSPFKI